MIYFIFSLIPILIYLLVKTTKGLQILQQNRYNDNKWYIKWLIENKKANFKNKDIIYILLFILGFFIKDKILMIISFILGLFILTSYLKIKKQEQNKKPLVYTKRVKRLIYTFLIVHIIIIGLILYKFNIELINYYYLIITVLVYLNYFVLYLVNCINKPIEKMYFKHYKNQAIKKLDSLNYIKVIGITGSYGKTSSKNILNDILNLKYNSFPTPKNFNTEIGLINTINNYLDKFNDYFIAEMGALNKDDILKYCKLVKPTYGILTTIGQAHLETFGSQENIQKGKFDLIESLPSNGIGILNADDKLQTSYKIKNNCKIVWVGIDNKDVDIYADNIKLSSKGTTFNIYFKKLKKAYPFETILLGKNNIYNILQAVALGYELGMSIEELQRGVSKVKPVEHRLELKQNGNVTIIDDAYNSNPVGSKMALDVLNMMDGYKVIVTPGMVELGEKQYELNKKFGNYIADVCDEVILVGKNQTKPIYDGLLEKKYKKKIHVIEDVKEAFTMIDRTKKTYVLLENDLPDIFL